MTTTTTTTRPLVYEVTGTMQPPGSASAKYEVRPATLTAAASLLGTPVASFAAVQVAAALADLERCPVCKDHPRRDTDPDVTPRRLVQPEFATPARHHGASAFTPSVSPATA